MIRIFLSLIVVLSFGCATAQMPYSIIYDGQQTEVFGATNMRTLHNAIYTFQDKYIPDTLGKETRLPSKMAGIGYRAAKSILLDLQEDYLIAVGQHEMFGHGARYREFGYYDNSYHLSLYYPFTKGGGGYARAGKLKGGEVVTRQEDLTMVLAGNESNLLLANNLTDNMLLNNSMHYRQALLYLIAQNNQLVYIWTSKFKKVDPTFGDGDMKSYIFELNNFYITGGKALNIEDMSRQSLVSILNPVQLYSAFTLFYIYGIRGKKKITEIPMIRIGGVKYLPALNYSLTPFGSRYHLINYFKYKHTLFSGDFHSGNYRLNRYYGFDIKALNFFTSKKIDANAYFSLWNQPELELHDKTVKSFNNKTGGLVKIDLNVRPFKLPNRFGGFLQLGYKTKGYTMGEMLDEGMIFRFGLSFYPASDR